MIKILKGLLFIHQNLNLYHGHLNCGQLLLDYQGHVKIGIQTSGKLSLKLITL